MCVRACVRVCVCVCVCVCVRARVCACATLRRYSHRILKLQRVANRQNILKSSSDDRSMTKMMR